MSNRRFEMYEYRAVLVRMRQGDSDRAIARSGLMGRSKVRRFSSLGRSSRMARVGQSPAGGRGDRAGGADPQLSAKYRELVSRALPGPGGVVGARGHPGHHDPARP